MKVTRLDGDTLTPEETSEQSMLLAAVSQIAERMATRQWCRADTYAEWRAYLAHRQASPNRDDSFDRLGCHLVKEAIALRFLVTPTGELVGVKYVVESLGYFVTINTADGGTFYAASGGFKCSGTITPGIVAQVNIAAEALMEVLDNRCNRGPST